VDLGMLGLHCKPYGVLNVAGYYDSLIRFLDHAGAHGFVRPEQRAMLAMENDPSRLFDAIGVAGASR
jgi:predicted Rossmann-fold nucleotide-binding protein